MTPNLCLQQGYSRYRLLLLSLLTGCLPGFLPAPLRAAYPEPVPKDKPAYFPDWWFEREVIKRINPSVTTPLWHRTSGDPDYLTSDDFAAFNEGQLKAVVKAAVAELTLRLPGGAGTDLNNLVAAWDASPTGTREDFSAVNAGQLKAVTSLINSRLSAAGYYDRNLWAQNAGGADDYTAANLGQLKNFFGFDITGLEHDVWTGISGTTITSIPITTTPGDSGYPGTRDRDKDPFEDTRSTSDYGERLSGYLVPPASGVYRFWVLASGTAQLYISNDGDPVNSLLRAEVTSTTSSTAWSGAGKSTLLWLEKGRPYYVELRHKAGTAGGGGNFVKVGWLLPTIPANADPMAETAPTEVIPASALWRRNGNPAPVFTPPSALTWSDANSATNADSHLNYNAAVRFLTQATFGPSGWGTDASYDYDGVWHDATLAGTGSSVVPYDVSRVNTLGFEGWIDEQMNRTSVSIPQTRLNDWVQKVHEDKLDLGGHQYWHTHFYTAWWRTAITARDQLRQRVAFALSEIMVVSNYALGTKADACSDYYDDALSANAFGNFRDILSDVTKHPAMGMYLNMLKNNKPTADPATTANAQVPNENYARELLQLFSIGTQRLNPDGTLLLNSAGEPVATYDQKTVEGIAHVFTGWDYDYDRTGYNPHGYPPWYDFSYTFTSSPFPHPYERYIPEFIRPMIPNPAQHFTGQKRILDNIVLPGMPKLGSTAVPAYGDNSGVSGLSTDSTYTGLAQAELDVVLDAIFNHPNCGPFICRQLIQRLVTSNPTPGYVYRVTSKFNNDGTTGTGRHNGRGNMDSVIKAILTDYEARSATMLSEPTFGKQREPVCRVTAVARAFPSTDTDPELWVMLQTSSIPPDTWWMQDLHQTPLGAPSVFNFFRPDYKFPGDLAANNMTTPEFQLTTSTSVINQANFVSDAFFTNGEWVTTPADGKASFVMNSKKVCMDLQQWRDLTDNDTELGTLIDELNKRLMAGQLPSAAKQVIKNLVSPKSVSSATVSGTVATITSSSPHGLTTDDLIVFHPAPSGEPPRKVFKVTVTGTNTFTIEHDTSYGTYSGKTFSGIWQDTQRERLFNVVNLMVNSPDFIIQR